MLTSAGSLSLSGVVGFIEVVNVRKRAGARQHTRRVESRACQNDYYSGLTRGGETAAAAAADDRLRICREAAV